MRLAEKDINSLFDGDFFITPDIAVKLEAVLGVPASYWTHLETSYRKKLQMVSEENLLEQDSEHKTRRLYRHSNARCGTDI